ncbi:Coiled-coil and C2 domain-containing protein 2A [Cichlidogyrus casuarinus]|uniref:Coiled-coil and C2 domain-containing protein 2A n=1 Tax=Cichlidogyrus casuarinus TaxID=1844966 RepID=A0ABD2Q4B4_9PLAT
MEQRDTYSVFVSLFEAVSCKLVARLPADLDTLDSVEDVILISVYDETMYQSNETEKGKFGATLMTMAGKFGSTSRSSGDMGQAKEPSSATIVQNIERRWLGGIELPFSTVYANMKVDGKMRLSIPVILMGYEMNALNPNSYLSLYVTLDPCVQTNEPLREKLPTFETDKLLEAVQFWEAQAIKKSPKDSNRVFRATVMNSNCQEILACRFLTPLNPPQELIHGETTGLSLEQSIVPRKAQLAILN